MTRWYAGAVVPVFPFSMSVASQVVPRGRGRSGNKYPY